MLTIETNDCNNNYMEIYVIFMNINKSRSLILLGPTAASN